MSTPKEINRLFPPKYAHKQIVSVNAGDMFTLNFVSSGTDTATTKFFGLGSLGAVAINIEVNGDVKINKINNVTLDDPLPFGTDFTDKYIGWLSCELQAEAADTVISVYVHGGNI